MSKRVPLLGMLLVLTGASACVPVEWLEETGPAPVADAPASAGTPESLRGGTIRAGSVSVVVPAGWQQTSDTAAPHVVFLRPQGVDDSAVRLAIPPGEDYRGDPAAYLRLRWQELMGRYASRGDPVVREGTSPEGHRWAGLSATLHMGVDGFKPVVFIAAADGTRVQPLFWYYRDEESMSRYGAAVDHISGSVRFLAAPERAAPRAIPLASMIPRSCLGCAHTFTGAPRSTPTYLIGTWATGSLDHFEGAVPQYADGMIYTFRADGTYQFSGMIASGSARLVTQQRGRFRVEGDRLTIERLGGETNDGGQLRPVGAQTMSFDWRPALSLSGAPMLVLRASADHEWEGYFRRER